MFVLFFEFLDGTRLVFRSSMPFTYDLLIRRWAAFVGYSYPINY